MGVNSDFFKLLELKVAEGDIRNMILVILTEIWNYVHKEHGSK